MMARHRGHNRFSILPTTSAPANMTPATSP
jgi:hypothetical protein